MAFFEFLHELLIFRSLIISEWTISNHESISIQSNLERCSTAATFSGMIFASLFSLLNDALDIIVRRILDGHSALFSTCVGSSLLFVTVVFFFVITETSYHFYYLIIINIISLTNEI